MVPPLCAHPLHIHISIETIAHCMAFLIHLHFLAIVASPSLTSTSISCCVTRSCMVWTILVAHTRVLIHRAQRTSCARCWCFAQRIRLCHQAGLGHALDSRTTLALHLCRTTLALACTPLELTLAVVAVGRSRPSSERCIPATRHTVTRPPRQPAWELLATVSTAVMC